MSILDGAGLPLIVVVAVAVIVAVRRGRPSLALGILFAATSLSGITATFFEVGIRPEQPAILLVAALVAVRDREATLTVFRRARWPIAFAALFLAANVASAWLYAPDPVQSLKICVWLAISLLAALVAAVLVVASRRDEGRDTERDIAWWIVASACLHAGAAVVQVGAEVLVQSDWGVLRSDVAIGKAFGLAWEPNLLAIQLAAAAMFLIDPRNRGRFPPGIRVGSLALIAAGIALSLSRGGIVALGAGIAIFLLMAMVGGDRRRSAELKTIVLTSALVAVIAGGGYLGLSWLAANGVGLRPGEVAAGPVQPPGSLVPVAPRPSPASTTRPDRTTDPLGPTPGVAASPSPAPAPPLPTPGTRQVGAGDTIELRVRNFLIAVADGMTSPSSDSVRTPSDNGTWSRRAPVPRTFRISSPRPSTRAGAAGSRQSVRLDRMACSSSMDCAAGHVRGRAPCTGRGIPVHGRPGFGGTWISDRQRSRPVIADREPGRSGREPNGTPRPSPQHTTPT